MAGAGCLWVLLTGGEILVRKDFLDIYDHAKKTGFLITLFTNATLVTPALAEHLGKRSPFSMEVSLYGRSEATHDRVTGVAGSFARTMRGVRLLMDVGIAPILKTMVLKPNAHEIWDLKSFVEEELGLEFRFDAMINPRVDPPTVFKSRSGSTQSMPATEQVGSGKVDPSTAPLHLRLSPREVVQFDLKDSSRMKEWVNFCNYFVKYYHDAKQINEVYRCGAGRNAFAIDASGKLSTCVLWHGEKYDLRKGTFKKGWEDFLLEVSRKKTTRNTKCLACELRSMCGMCPANGVLECGDAEEPVAFLCQVAHLRAYAFGIRVPPHGSCEYCPGGSRYPMIMTMVKELAA
jgi:radical SAM protein with 4Fe4S-binding SPASM domain